MERSESENGKYKNMFIEMGYCGLQKTDRQTDRQTDTVGKKINM
jgi:hypothetical protein